MIAVKEKSLVAGEMVKFRRLGYREECAAQFKKDFAQFEMPQAIIRFLDKDPENFVATYSGSSHGVYEFLRGSISHWSMNHHEQFAEWYEKRAPDKAKLFIQQQLRLQVDPESVWGGTGISETVGLGKVPKDLFIPQEARDRIAENSAKIDSDRGDENFVYGILKYADEKQTTATVLTFVGNWHTWLEFHEIELKRTGFRYSVDLVEKFEFLDAMRDQIGAYELPISKGGIPGLIEARKQFMLQGVYDRLEAADSPTSVLDAINLENKLPAPGTGVYVIIGKNITRANPDPFVVKVTPKYEEKKVAQIVGVIFEYGSNTILEAFEVPEKALKYVGEHRTLEIKFG